MSGHATRFLKALAVIGFGLMFADLFTSDVSTAAKAGIGVVLFLGMTEALRPSTRR